MHFSDLVGAVTSLTVVIGLITTIYKAVKYFHPDEETWQDKLAIVLCIVAFGIVGLGVFVGMSSMSAAAIPATRQPVPVVSTVIPSFPSSNDQSTPAPTNTTGPQPTPTPGITPTLGATSTVIPTSSPPRGTAVPTSTTTPAPTPTPTQGTTAPPATSPTVP